jgi:serine/threonine protein phosphatase PrpC
MPSYSIPFDNLRVSMSQPQGGIDLSLDYLDDVAEKKLKLDSRHDYSEFNVKVLGPPKNVAPSEYLARDPSIEKVKKRLESALHLDTSQKKPLALMMMAKEKDLNRGVVGLQSESLSVGSYQVSVTHFIGKRPTQEDVHFVEEVSLGKTKIPVFAICDGHGGIGAALFFKDKGKEIIEELFKKSFFDSDQEIPNNDAAIENALMMLGVQVQERLIETRLGPCADMYSRGGTTLTLATVIGGTIWTANVGDSRTIAVGENGKAHQLTEDATLEKGRFLSGYLQRGGIPVRDSFGIMRTPAGLMMPRSLGERDAAVSCRASVTKYPIPEEGTTLVLGCDGLFDVLSSDDVAHIVHSEDYGLVSEKLVEEAFINGSEDNISVLVVRIPTPISFNKCFK